MSGSMRRRLFTFLSAFSLVLCVATVGIWLWGYGVPSERLLWVGPRTRVGIDVRFTEVEVRSGKGGLFISRQTFFTHDGMYYLIFASKPGWRLDSSMYMGFGGVKTAFGFGAFRGTWSDFQTTAYGTDLVIPDWFLVTAFMAAPLLWIRSHRRRFRSVNSCATCGYDIHATPDRCPECGTVPPKKIRISN
jgi:hypothetical protein